MSNFGTEPSRDGEPANRLENAVACLDMIDGRVAERCSVPVLQDLVGNLLLILARIAEAGDAGNRPAADVLGDCRALARESLTIAGLAENNVDDAISAVATVDAITSLRLAKRG